MPPPVMPLTLVQMSGVPGSGKTTVATAIARRTGAVVVDLDVVKTALLDEGAPIETAGKLAYAALHACAEHLLAQGQSVVFDSPCFYSEGLARCRQIAEQSKARYRYVECRVEDLDLLDRRLRSRPASRSQRRGVRLPPRDLVEDVRPGDELFRHWLDTTRRPDTGFVVLDTAQPLERCLEPLWRYLGV